MKTILATAVLMIAAATLAEAAQTDYNAGKVFGSELTIPLGARPAAMGQAFAGVADDFNALAWNPAGLAQLTVPQAGLLHSIYFQGTSMEYVTYAQGLSSGAGLGANLAYFNYGSLDKATEVNGAPNLAGTFTPTSLAVSLGYGQWLLTNLGAGAAVKYFNETIDSQSFSAVAVDLAGLYRVSRDLQAGLVIQNLGPQVAGSSLPLNLKIGGAYTLAVSSTDSMKFAMDVNFPMAAADNLSVGIGTEYTYNQMFDGRLGYVLRNNGELSGLVGLTAGLGARFGVLALDYAMVTFGDLGLTHQLMLSIDFGGAGKPAAVNTGRAEVREKIVYRENPADPGNRAKIAELEAQKKALEEKLVRFSREIEVGKLNPILFETDRNTLLKSAFDTLDRLGNILAQYPELVVRVEGHTDDVGSAAHNLKLSQNRSEIVCDYLAMKYSAIRRKNLIPIGYGATRPLIKSKTNAARAKNRRVEFIVINPYMQ